MRMGNNVGKLHTKLQWASLIIKRLNGRHTPVRITHSKLKSLKTREKARSLSAMNNEKYRYQLIIRQHKNGLVHTDSKINKIDLKIYFLWVSRKVPLGNVWKLHAKFYWGSSIRKLWKIEGTMVGRRKKWLKFKVPLNLKCFVFWPQ